MTPPKKLDIAAISVDNFNYHLPPERIASTPLTQRDESKLLVYKNGQINDAVYLHIDQFLPSGSLLVFNNSKVVQARLNFKTTSDANVEIFCLEPASKQIEINTAMQSKGKVVWRCLVGELRKWKEERLNRSIPFKNKSFVLSAKLLEKEKDTFLIQFEWDNPEITFAEILETAGNLPLPPYIKRNVQEEDKVRYQTIYANHKGSVAAPTAGLHFTDRIFNNLKAKNIGYDYVTLHIGAGTFKPVKTPSVAEHEMHSEQLVLELDFIKNLISHLNKDIIAVGTTSLRTLESLYWLGVKIDHLEYNLHNDITLEQWDAYKLKSILTAEESLKAIVKYLEMKGDRMLLTRTQLLIVPGYDWKIVNGLVTNFHQPKSTLIMLVAAFIGEDWKKIYNHAFENNYRFLSYGDGSLLLR
jgi:S-adenosylmethionine:tRNA ribosyltransferase-isomerase